MKQGRHARYGRRLCSAVAGATAAGMLLMMMLCSATAAMAMSMPMSMESHDGEHDTDRSHGDETACCCESLEWIPLTDGRPDARSVQRHTHAVDNIPSIPAGSTVSCLDPRTLSALWQHRAPPFSPRLEPTSTPCGLRAPPAHLSI